jgi:hypothetical protein
MNSFLESVFNDAENRYLKPEELRLLSQYVNSLPDRLQVYRTLRDREIEIMQWVADQLEAAMPQEKAELLERSIKNMVLMLRYCAMGMLMNDDRIVRDRYVAWFGEMSSVYGTEAIDATLHQYLNQRLTQILSSKEMNLLKPLLLLAQGREPQTAALSGNLFS